MISFAKTAEEQMERNDKSIVRLKAELEERESAAKKDKEDNDNMLVMISKISDMLKEPEKLSAVNFGTGTVPGRGLENLGTGHRIPHRPSNSGTGADASAAGAAPVPFTALFNIWVL
uniref:Uncharacterized protein n=1 Tax=Ditylenchus dipsaci TaxID=166011 RepID=A0A915DIP7_9BILA